MISSLVRARCSAIPPLHPIENGERGGGLSRFAVDWIHRAVAGVRKKAETPYATARTASRLQQLAHAPRGHRAPAFWGSGNSSQVRPSSSRPAAFLPRRSSTIEPKRVNERG